MTTCRWCKTEIDPTVSGDCACPPAPPPAAGSMRRIKRMIANEPEQTAPDDSHEEESDMSKTKKKATTKKGARAPRQGRADPKQPATEVETSGIAVPAADGFNTWQRVYKGTTLTLESATGGGFIFNGAAYKSMTAAAKAATGYPSISGTLFWMHPAKAGAK